MFRDNYTFTKRHLGILCVILGILAIFAILAVDLVRNTQGGIGPAQRIGLGLAIVLTLLGLSLLPLGDDPA